MAGGFGHYANPMLKRAILNISHREMRMVSVFSSILTLISQLLVSFILWLVFGLDTCTAACSVTCALFGSLWLDPAATEGGAVSDLFAFLLRWRSAHCVWTVAAGVHPPAGRKQRTRSREFVPASWSPRVSEGGQIKWEAADVNLKTPVTLYL